MTIISDNNKGRSRPLGTLGGSWRLLIIPVLLIMILPIGVNATMFRNDSRHTGVYNDGGSSPTNALNWSFQPNTNASLDASLWASPTVVNGVVYIGGNDQIMYAINAFTGASIWNSTISNGDIDSSAAVSNGRVIFGSYDSNVYSLDLNGVKVWNRSTSSGIRTSPAVENGYIYIANDAGRVYRLIESSGVIDWNVSTNLTPGGGMHSSPAVANGIVYVGNMDGKLYALYANNGTQFWNYTTTAGQEVYSSPAVVNDVVYVGSNDQGLYAIGATNGTILWRVETGGGVASSPAVANGSVYFGSFDRNLYAINAITGAPQWRFRYRIRYFLESCGSERCRLCGKQR